MIIKNILYKIKTAQQNDILIHLNSCNNDFIPSLDSKVDINDYAKKLFLYSVTFEAWEGELLAGLIGASPILIGAMIAIIVAHDLVWQKTRTVTFPEVCEMVLTQLACGNCR